ncbi:MAG: hypothetical protein GYB67_08960 [Chloroflexi bacterium]|nr:hypothetical protein [Chloroflexota bacterium]
MRQHARSSRQGRNWRLTSLTRLVIALALLTLVFGVVDPSNPAEAATFVNAFTNNLDITIPSFGAASSYPSNISLSLPGRRIIDVNVTILGLSHPSPSNLDVLLEGPDGETVLLFSDVCGNGDVVNRDWEINDDVGSPFPSNGPCNFSSTFNPTNLGSGSDIFPSPAPGSPYGSSLSVFDGADPSGNWALYVYDDLQNIPPQSGSIDGWRLTLTTSDVIAIDIPASGGSGVAAPYPSTVNVQNQFGLIQDVNLQLNGLTHSFPDDIEMLLVAPNGRDAIVMADACGGADVTDNLINYDVTIDDEAASPFPTGGPCLLANYQPESYGGTETLPAPAPPQPYGSTMAVFDGHSPNGTWRLYINDDRNGDDGFLIDGWSPVFTSLSNAAIDIPGSASNTSGVASPYPSTRTVSGRTGMITDVDVTLTGLSHTRPDDLEIMLRAPSGAMVMLMRDRCGNTDLNNVNFTFDDDILAGPLPGAGPCSGGTYNVGNDGSGPSLPLPAPPGPYGSSLSIFDGQNPNGNWTLFVYDDLGGDTGFVNVGWSLSIATTTTGSGGGDRVGIYNPSTALWALRNSLTTGGETTLVYVYGGIAGGIAMLGDWNGNGIDSPGIYVPSLAYWFMRNTNTTGGAEIAAVYGGIQGALPVVGDWDGNGTDTIGLYNPATGQWLLRNSNTTGNPNISFVWGGIPGALPVVGDWNGDGTDTIGLYNPANALWILRNSNNSGPADVSLVFGGIAGGLPVVGDWNDSGTDTVGIYVPSLAYWFLSNVNITAGPQIVMVYGGVAGATPVAGYWGDSTLVLGAAGPPAGYFTPSLASGDVAPVVPALDPGLFGLNAPALLEPAAAPMRPSLSSSRAQPAVPVDPNPELPTDIVPLDGAQGRELPDLFAP